MIDAQHRCDVGFVGGSLYLITCNIAFKIRHRMFLIHIG